MQLADALKDSRIFQNLSAEQLETALGAVRAREAVFARGETLAIAGGELRAFFCLLSGSVQGVRYQANGDADLVQLFLPGEIIGLDIAGSATKRCPFWLTAIEPCSGVFVDFDTLFSPELPQEITAALGQNVIRALANDSIRRLHKIDVLYRKGLRARIAVFLRHMAIMNGSREFSINMDREQLSQYLGVNRSALSHELSRMRKEGLIDFHKNRFAVLSDEIAG